MKTNQKKSVVKWNSVQTWREAGIEAKWGKSNGRPTMFIKPSHSKNFYMLTKSNLECIEHSLDQGNSLKEAVDGVFAVADIFSI